MMDSRERVFTALDHKQPDRVPVDFWAVSEVIDRLYKETGLKTETELHDFFEVDLCFAFPDEPGPTREYLSDGSFIDKMGTHRREVANQYSTYFEYASSPLGYIQKLEDFESYTRWPDPKRFDWSGYSEKIGELNKRRIIKLHTGGLFEYAWALRGYEPFMMDMALNPEIAHFIMDKLCEYWIEYVSLAMDAAGDKIDIVYTYDDIAAQNSLLMSPGMIEEFVLPYHRKLNKHIHSFGKLIKFHSCGAVYPVIQQLIDLPIEILNPLQPRAKDMDFARIKSEFGAQVSFHGGIDLQETMPKGSPDDVRAEVRHAVETLGAGGGYIMTTAHYMQNDIPSENIYALYELSLR